MPEQKQDLASSFMLLVYLLAIYLLMTGGRLLP